MARPEEIGAMFLSVALAMPIGFGLLQITQWSIRAAEVSLFLLLESVIAPILVWIGFGEVPSQMTVIGSAVSVMALLFYSYQSVRKVEQEP